MDTQNAIEMVIVIGVICGALILMILRLGWARTHPEQIAQKRFEQLQKYELIQQRAAKPSQLPKPWRMFIIIISEMIMGAFLFAPTIIFAGVLAEILCGRVWGIFIHIIAGAIYGSHVDGNSRQMIIGSVIGILIGIISMLFDNLWITIILGGLYGLIFGWENREAIEHSRGVINFRIGGIMGTYLGFSLGMIYQPIGMAVFIGSMGFVFGAFIVTVIADSRLMNGG